MKKLLTEWRKFLNERVMYHSTSPENVEAILSQGLEAGRESDDCEQAISVKYARDTNSDPKWGWSAQPTAYLYRVSGTPTMDALEASGQLLELEQQ